MTFHTGPDLIEFWEDEPSGLFCPDCGQEMDWEECGLCDDAGFAGHDCGEDCCPCLDPEPNERCEQCEGIGGWWLCTNTDCKGDDDERPEH